MKNLPWIMPLLTRLTGEGFVVREEENQGLASARLVVVERDDWQRLAHAAKDESARYVGGWADDMSDALHVYCVFEKQAQYLIARARLSRSNAALPSQAPAYAGALRCERHMHDLYGIDFAHHPDPRRWTRHLAWHEDEYPLCKDYPVSGQPAPITPADDHYPFMHAQGGGVYEIPVGPVHAGIIEPGHFRFQAVGEIVLNLEERLGYVHKGIEKIAEGRDAIGLARLAGRVSGDSTVAHAWAACMAMERAANVNVPPRSLHLRAIMCERERVANHLGDIGAVCNDVAFAFGFYQFARLREQWQRTSADIFGHRLMMDRVIPGGVTVDIRDAGSAHMRADSVALRGELKLLARLLEEWPSLEDRLVTTGYLSPELALQFGVLGYLARASGVDFDLRRHAPYAPYDALSVKVPVYEYGDIAGRNRVRMEEILVALELIDLLLDTLPPGPTRADWLSPTNCDGLGLVEGWRGEILAYVRFDAGGRIGRYYPRDPSVMNWPALEKLVRDNIVPDFPVCNKSVNGSYSGNDL